jgi:hypothetical protein
VSNRDEGGKRDVRDALHGRRRRTSLVGHRRTEDGTVARYDIAADRIKTIDVGGKPMATRSGWRWTQPRLNVRSIVALTLGPQVGYLVARFVLH